MQNECDHPVGLLPWAKIIKNKAVCLIQALICAPTGWRDSSVKTVEFFTGQVSRNPQIETSIKKTTTPIYSKWIFTLKWGGVLGEDLLQKQKWKVLFLTSRHYLIKPLWSPKTDFMTRLSKYRQDELRLGASRRPGALPGWWRLKPSGRVHCRGQWGEPRAPQAWARGYDVTQQVTEIGNNDGWRSACSRNKPANVLNSRRLIYMSASPRGGNGFWSRKGVK